MAWNFHIDLGNLLGKKHEGHFNYSEPRDSKYVKLRNSSASQKKWSENYSILLSTVNITKIIILLHYKDKNLHIQSLIPGVHLLGKPIPFSYIWTLVSMTSKF